MFKTVDEVDKVLSQKKTEQMFVLMINYGDYEVEWLLPCDQTVVDGIRVAFHKKDYREALKFCEKVSKKLIKLKLLF